MVGVSPRYVFDNSFEVRTGLFFKQTVNGRHVGVEFLSPHANIYESTHAHYDRTICICILLINESQVSHMCE